MPNAYFAWSIDNDGKPCLSHHGIKGQKWGVITKEYEPVGRQSPRYRPNTYSNTGPKSRTNTYTSLGPKQRKYALRKTSNKEKTDNGRRWLAGLGIGLGVAAATYGAYRLHRGTRRYLEGVVKRGPVYDRYLRRSDVINRNMKMRKASNYISKEAYKSYLETRKKDSRKYLKYLLTGKWGKR